MHNLCTLWSERTGRKGRLKHVPDQPHRFVPDCPCEYKNYIKFPADLKDKYQPFTKSNNENIKSSGYDNKFYSIEEGVNKYLKYLDTK